MSSEPVTLLGAAVLASALPVARWSARLTVRNRRRWKAISAGVAVAYMFVGVLPELAEHAPVVAAGTGGVLKAEKRIYTWALAGFVVFARLSEISSNPGTDAARQQRAGLLFFIRVSAFAIYLALIGYLLVHREDHSASSLWLYVTAMGLHAFMLDIVMAETFNRMYGWSVRAALMVSIFLGYGLGIASVVPDAITSRLFAFVLGGVTITGAHEELKGEQTGHLWWFVCASAAYATLLRLV